MDELTENGPLSDLETVWARHARAEAEPDLVPRQGLSRRRVVEAAVELADAEGLGAVSMSRVARALGFTTMSLYRHVRSKDELLLLMQDAAVGSPPEHPPAPHGWRAELEWWAWAVLAGMRRHPWIVQTLSMFGPPATPYQLAWLELGLRALAGTGLTEPEKLSTMLLVDSQVFSDLQFAAFGEPTAPPEGLDPYRALLTRVLDPERFPALFRALEGGAFDDSADPVADRDTDFAFGLARILDGVERLVEQRAGAASG